MVIYARSSITRRSFQKIEPTLPVSKLPLWKP
jgi:hypothetical protein